MITFHPKIISQYYCNADGSIRSGPHSDHCAIYPNGFQVFFMEWTNECRASNLDQLSVHVFSQNLEDVVAALVLGDGVEVVPLAAGVFVEPVAGVDVLVHVATHQVA